MGGTHATAIDDEVTVGSDAIVAAGSLVVEGVVVPPRSLVMGNPGQIRRILTEDEVASSWQYAAGYVEHKNEYASP